MPCKDLIKDMTIGLPREIRRLICFGDFPAAGEQIDLILAKNIPLPLRNCLLVHKEILRRLPASYTLSADEAVHLAQSTIPDFTMEELQLLEKTGRADYIWLMGEKRYFNMFFETLIKTHADYIARASVSRQGVDGHDAENIMAPVFREMSETGSSTWRLRCRATIRLRPEVFEKEKGHKLRIWLPLPCLCRDQRDIRIEAVSPVPVLIAPEDAPQRTVFWEETAEKEHPFTVEFSYTREAFYTDLYTAAESGIPDPYPLSPFAQDHAFFEEQDLQEQLPHIRFTPYIRMMAAELTKAACSPLEKAKRIYDFITQNVKYAFVPAYFCLEDIAENCARDLRGDCGVMALLFITLCRCAGIPAAWESGWKAAPDFCGSHDWARFFIEPYGWLYADLSFGTGGFRDHNEARRRHYFGNLDPFRMSANRAFQEALTPPTAFWRADPYDNQVGEMENETRCFDSDELLCEQTLLSCEHIISGSSVRRFP